MQRKLVSSSSNRWLEKSFADVKMNRKGKVKTLAAMTSSIVVHEQEVRVSPQQLFNGIICLLDGSADLPSFLMYELAPRPPSLFDQVSLRRTAKAALSSLLAVELPDNPQHVVDGGYLLQTGIWTKPATYDDVCQYIIMMTYAVYNSPLQTWCQSYIWWSWPAALHKISRTCQESIKESLSKHLDGWKYAY